MAGGQAQRCADRPPSIAEEGADKLHLGGKIGWFRLLLPLPLLLWRLVGSVCVRVSHLMIPPQLYFRLLHGGGVGEGWAQSLREHVYCSLSTHRCGPSSRDIYISISRIYGTSYDVRRTQICSCHLHSQFISCVTVVQFSTLRRVQPVG